MSLLPNYHPLHVKETEQLQQRLEAVRRKVHEATLKAGRPPESVQLVAVSKFHPAAMICALAALPESTAQWHFAENYVQEAVEKQAIVTAQLPAEKIHKLQWHFIGHLQRNKAKYIFGRFALLHTLASVQLATTLHNLWQRAMDAGDAPAPQAILIQVNIGDEAQKNGVPLDSLPALVDAVVALPSLRLTGLMGIAPVCPSPEAARPYFASLRAAQERLQKQTGLALPELSMGMSMDMEAAVAEGATIVRIGTDIFGTRSG